MVAEKTKDLRSKIGGRAAEWDAIPVVVRAHTTKCAAPRHKTFEVVNVRRLQIRSGGTGYGSMPPFEVRKGLFELLPGSLLHH